MTWRRLTKKRSMFWGMIMVDPFTMMFVVGFAAGYVVGFAIVVLFLGK